ncbi:MAG: hypothetical protein K2K13_03515 [Clostridiales bacterium]|nr:hypothetical protein [Clostridiales bacterium]
MKRKILTAIILTVILALSLFTAACGDDGVTYKVIADYNSEQGTVSVTAEDGKAKTEFAAGDKAVINVEANEGYELDRFIVNGESCELDNGSYTFSVSSNTLVQATFKKSKDDDDDDDNKKTPEELFAEAFKSVKTTFMAVGSYTYKEEGQDPHVNNVTTVFGDGAVNIVEMDDETGRVLYDSVYVDKDGKLAEPYHTIDNKMEYNSPDEDEAFADYDNPFKALTAADFAATDTENIFALTDAAKAKKAATAITGWVEDIASFTVTIRDGKVTRINIVTDRIKRGPEGNEYYYTSSYAFTVSGWGTAAVDPDALTPYATTAAHTALKNALQAASEAKNYTAHIYEQEAGYEDLEYDVYVTETAIYDSCTGWEAGYVEKNLTPDNEDGMRVYSFRIGGEKDSEEKKGKVVIGDAVNYPTVKAMRADFGGFAPEIFQNDGEVYTLQSDCIRYTSDVLVHFSDGADNIILYRNYTLSVQITLKDGKLYQVEMYYYVYGALVKRTVTYSAWDETTMPLSFDDYVKESVFDSYVGIYTDRNIVVKVTTDGISVNNVPMVISTYSATQQIFSGTVNGKECYVMYMSEKQLAVVLDNRSYVVTNIELDAVEIPEAYNGVWQDENANSVTIAYNKITFGTNMLKVLSYDETEGLVALRGDYTYRLILGQLQGKTVLSVRALNSGMMSQTYVMSKVQNGFIIPQTFVGTYTADGLVQYKVVVTLNGVTVQIDNKQYVAADVSVGEDDTMGTVINFKLNGESYAIAQDPYGRDGVYFAGDGADVTLSRTADDDPAAPPVVKVDIPEAFYGDYTFSDIPNGVFYSLSIDDDGIFALIDMSSNEYTAEILEFDEQNPSVIKVSINGKIFYLYGSVDNINDDGNYNIITFKNDKTGDDGIEVELLRDDYDPDEGYDTFTVPELFIGVYEGTRSDGVKFVLTVTETGMTLKVDDAEPVKVTIRNYETTASRTRFTVKISKINYSYVNYMGNFSEQTEPIQKLIISGDDANVILNRVTETA